MCAYDGERGECVSRAGNARAASCVETGKHQNASVVQGLARILCCCSPRLIHILRYPAYKCCQRSCLDFISMPGGVYCCVYGCLNNSKHNKGKNFFSLPADPEKLSLWLSVIQREDLLEKSKSGRLTQRVCCDHFGVENFRYVKNLKPDAIPHLKLPGFNSPEESKAGPSSLKQDSPTIKKFHVSTQTFSCEMMDSSSQTSEVEENEIDKSSENTINSQNISGNQTPLSLTTNTPRKKKLKLDLKTENEEIISLDKMKDPSDKSVTIKTFKKEV